MAETLLRYPALVSIVSLIAPTVPAVIVPTVSVIAAVIFPMAVLINWISDRNDGTTGKQRDNATECNQTFH